MPSPETSPTGQPRLVVAAGLVWLTAGRLLVQRRPPHKPHGGSLELPGGKVEAGEAPIEALRRELVEEWGPHARLLTPLSVAEVLHHVYPPPGPEVLLVVYHVDASAWAGLDADGERWAALLRAEAGACVYAVDLSDLPLDEFLAADRGFMRAVRDGNFAFPAGSSAG
ncbi:MAG: NUDIX domain-containing protein [Myxococcales bacterium]|nr:NUDIX domain-containing protein [Myxococcales bacterium]